MVGLAKGDAQQRAGLAAQMQLGPFRGFEKGNRGQVFGLTMGVRQGGHFFGLRQDHRGLRRRYERPTTLPAR